MSTFISPRSFVCSLRARCKNATVEERRRCNAEAALCHRSPAQPGPLSRDARCHSTHANALKVEDMEGMNEHTSNALKRSPSGMTPNAQTPRCERLLEELEGSSGPRFVPAIVPAAIHSAMRPGHSRYLTRTKSNFTCITTLPGMSCLRASTHR